MIHIAWALLMALCMVLLGFIGGIYLGAEHIEKLKRQEYDAWYRDGCTEAELCFLRRHDMRGNDAESEGSQ